VRDLVAGSDVILEDHGTYLLKGIDGDLAAPRRHTALTTMVPVGDFRDQSPAVVALHRYAKVCGLRPLCGRACHHGKGRPAGERAGQAGYTGS
jgi:hypothetical protein